MRIVDRVWMSNTFARTYIVEDPGGLVMIDANTSGEVHASLADFVRDGIDLSRLRAILLTHMHHDHAGGAAYLRSTYRAPVVIHALDAEPLAHHDASMTAADRKWTNTFDHVPACPVDHVVEDGDTIEVAGLTISVVHLPGHTRGGVGYLIDGNLFCGDTMYAHGGVGWADVVWASNIHDHVESIRRIAEVKPVRILGGHGDPGEWSPAVTDAALAYLGELSHAGLPALATSRVPRKPADAPRKTVRPAGLRDDPDVPSDVSDARYVPIRTGPRGSGSLRGMIRPLGELHGLILVGDRDVPITRPLAATMNLEHYCEEGRHGKFVPRIAVAQSAVVQPGRVEIHFAPNPEWAVRSWVEYAWDPAPADERPATVDIRFTFAFERDYKRFEAFIASYFWGERIPFVAAGGAAFRPEIKRGAQLFFPRDEDARRQVADGRWSFLTGSLFPEADPAGRTYDAPITIHRDDATGWTFVQMADRNACSAISVNTFAYAQDFSLLGRDVKAGEKATVRARVVYAKLDRPEDALDLWRSFQSDCDAERE